MTPDQSRDARCSRCNPQLRNTTSAAEQTPSTVQEQKPPNRPTDQDRQLRGLLRVQILQPDTLGVGSLCSLPLTGCVTSAKVISPPITQFLHL